MTAAPEPTDRLTVYGAATCQDTPRVVSSAAEAGGPVAPSGATDWLRFIALDCPECSGEIAWPD